jgi:hypothetical protein
MKQCRKCKQTKPLSEFYFHQRDGYYPRCKECVRKDRNAFRREHLEAVRSRDRNRPNQVLSTARHRRLDSAYNKRYPQKFAARKAVWYAIKTGKIIRQPCEVCGAKAQAHHDDYSRPLEVRWLCFVHHQIEHARLIVLPICS